MKSIKLADATREQLMEYAQNSMGLTTVPANANKTTIEARMKAAGFLGDEITVSDVQPQTERTMPETTAKPDNKKIYDERTCKYDPKVKLIIAPDNNPGGDEPVFMDVNNRGMLFPRSEKIDMPWRYYRALCDATRDEYYPHPETSEPVKRENIPLYSISVIQMPPQADIDAWEAAQCGLDNKAA